MGEQPERLPLRWLGVFLAVAVVFRLAIVQSWHQPAGDGLQYFQLSQELRRAGRFAFSPQPEPLCYSRLPGYPLFLAATISPGRPLSLEAHVRWAARVNVLLDVATALLVFAILRRRRLGGARLGLAMTLLCPTLWLFSSLAMTEPLSMLLGTLTLYLALRALDDGRTLRFAGAAGAAAGLGLLVRADAVSFVPGAVVILCALQKRRLPALAVFGAAALALFAPWPIRNQLRFGAPHFAATTWRDMDGVPLGEGPFEWARTWSNSRPGDAWFEVVMANHEELTPRRPGVLLPAMYDDDGEREYLQALFGRYNVVKLAPDVDAAFHELAVKRRARAPLRYYLTLPLGRMQRLWSPTPDWEVAMEVRWLGLPKLRPVMGWLDKLLFLAALAGAVVGWRRGQRLLVGAALACIGVRTLIYGWAIPHVTCGRYLAEIFPLLIVLGTIAIVDGKQRLARRLARR